MITPRIAITPGEPAGIGPDLVVELAQQDWPAELVVCADPDLLQQRAKHLGLPLKLRPYQPTQTASAQEKGTLTIAPAPLRDTVVPGELNEANSAYVIDTLKFACEQSLNSTFAAVVTGPVHKGIINQAGISFSGHTEYFAQLSNCPDVVMMLATEGLQVALVTTHIPLAYVAKAITPERLENVIRILNHDLKSKFGISQPKVLVCGLNPHAGEGGHLGQEEIDVIEPTMVKLINEGMDLEGPFPADTVFQPKYLDRADAILTMYHDQGLPVLKYKGFGHALNITLGLPFIRTSVDHGTALELAGTGQADPGSFHFALNKAIELASQSSS